MSLVKILNKNDKSIILVHHKYGIKFENISNRIGSHETNVDHYIRSKNTRKIRTQTMNKNKCPKIYMTHKVNICMCLKTAMDIWKDKKWRKSSKRWSNTSYYLIYGIKRIKFDFVLSTKTYTERK